MARLILKRLVDDRSLLLGVFAGVVLTTTIAAAGPAYLNSLEQLSFRDVRRQHRRAVPGARTFSRRTSRSPSARWRRRKKPWHGRRSVTCPPAYAGHTTYVRSSPLLVGIPGRELPDERSREILLRGYLQSLSGLDEHAALTEGKLNRGGVAQWPRGPLVEAVISRPTAERFGIGVGDTVSLATVVEVNTRISAIVTGVIRAGRPRRGVLGRSRGVPRPRTLVRDAALRRESRPGRPPDWTVRAPRRPHSGRGRYEPRNTGRPRVVHQAGQGRGWLVVRERGDRPHRRLHRGREGGDAGGGGEGGRDHDDHQHGRAAELLRGAYPSCCCWRSWA